MRFTTVRQAAFIIGCIVGPVLAAGLVVTEPAFRETEDGTMKDHDSDRLRISAASEEASRSTATKFATFALG